MKVNLKHMENKSFTSQCPYTALLVLLESMTMGTSTPEISGASMAQRFANSRGISTQPPLIADTIRNVYQSSIAGIQSINDVEIFYTELHVPTNPIKYAVIGLAPVDKYVATTLGGLEHTHTKEVDGVKKEFIKLYNGLYQMPNGELFSLTFIPDKFRGGNLNANHMDLVVEYCLHCGAFMESVCKFDSFCDKRMEYNPIALVPSGFPSLAAPLHILDITRSLDCLDACITEVQDIDADLYASDQEYHDICAAMKDIYATSEYKDDIYDIQRRCLSIAAKRYASEAYKEKQITEAYFQSIGVSKEEIVERMRKDCESYKEESDGSNS